MESTDQVVAGRGAARRWRWPPLRLPRPTGIRNGGLLLVLVAVAAVMAVVDQPAEQGQGGRRLPGLFQHLPPPVGITGSPPPVAEPPTGVAQSGQGAGQLDGEKPAATTARRHPRRSHPLRVGPGSSSGRRAGPTSGGGTGGSRPGSPPAASPAEPPTSPPVEPAPAVRARVPSVRVRVTPPRVLGRDLPVVEAETPEVPVSATGAAVPPRVKVPPDLLPAR